MLGGIIGRAVVYLWEEAAFADGVPHLASAELVLVWPKTWGMIWGTEGYRLASGQTRSLSDLVRGRGASLRPNFSRKD
jgi:hypothetical protein